ncbi:MAG: hypothetical protein ACJAU8_000585 [Candidatus Paceibacteria bacterium]|jgi:hypothetical protein
MKKRFEIGSLFRNAWKDYKANWSLFIIIGIIFILVNLLGNLGASFNTVTGVIEQSTTVSLIAWLLGMFISLGFIRFILNIVDEKERKVEDLFRGANSVEHFLFFIVVVMLYTALIGLGTVLLVIPGIVALVGFVFAQYLIAEEKSGIFESLKESWNMTSKNRWKIFWLMIVVLFFNIFGALALVIGLFITVPMTYLIYARLYRELSMDDLVTMEEEDMEVIEVMEGDHTESVED